MRALTLPSPAVPQRCLKCGSAFPTHRCQAGPISPTCVCGHLKLNHHTTTAGRRTYCTVWTQHPGGLTPPCACRMYEEIQ